MTLYVMSFYMLGLVRLGYFILRVCGLNLVFDFGV